MDSRAGEPVRLPGGKKRGQKGQSGDGLPATRLERPAGNKWDGFCIYGCVKPYNHETEEETEETADYGGGLYACEPQGSKARRDCRAREAGFNEVGAPQIQEGL